MLRSFGRGILSEKSLFGRRLINTILPTKSSWKSLKCLRRSKPREWVEKERRQDYLQPRRSLRNMDTAILLASETIYDIYTCIYIKVTAASNALSKSLITTSIYTKEKLIVNQALSCPAAWTELIQGPFKRHVVPGGHFYFMERDNESSVIKLVSAALGVQWSLHL